jgi:Domain of unknown function (DUF4149)
MTRTHALSIAILALWIGINLSVWFTATRTFSTVDHVMKARNSKFSRAVEPISAGNVRETLRYLASEINRTYFRAYAWAQIILGLILFVLVWRQSPRSALDAALVGGMLVIALTVSFILTPWISSLGRALDFVPRNPAPPEISRFWMLHGAFTGLDGIKLLAGILLLIRWIFRG